MTTEDPIDELIMKTDVVEGETRRVLVDLIKPFVRIDPDTGSVHFIYPQSRFTTKQHIIIYLLAKLAIASKKPGELSPSATPKEVTEATRLPGGTVRPKLRELLQERAISHNKEGYFIHSSDLHVARAFLEDLLKENTK